MSDEETLDKRRKDRAARLMALSPKERNAYLTDPEKRRVIQKRWRLEKRRLYYHNLSPEKKAQLAASAKEKYVEKWSSRLRKSTIDDLISKGWEILPGKKVREQNDKHKGRR